jgi:uncharacterized protein YoxC
MDLSTAQQILVVVLSTVLAIALILAVVVGVLVIKILKQARRVLDKAEHAVASAEAVGDVIKNVAGPATLLRVARFVFNMAGRRKK